MAVNFETNDSEMGELQSLYCLNVLLITNTGCLKES